MQGKLFSSWFLVPHLYQLWSILPKEGFIQSIINSQTMNLVGNYGSDEEDEEVEDVQKFDKITSFTKTDAQTRVEEPKKREHRKKKRLDVNILPPEIQMALTRGDSLYDSDEEDNPKLGGSLQSSEVKPKTFKEGGSALLSLLPKPQNSSYDSQLSQQQIQPSKTKDKKSEVGGGVGEGYHHLGEERSQDDYIPTESQYRPLLKRSGLDRPISSNFEGNYFDQSLSIEDQLGHESFDDVSGKKRRRDRELEIALLNGNLSAVTNKVGQIQEIQSKAGDAWDSTRYDDQRKRESMVQSSFNLGQNNLFTNPTKLQNRKHQINTLAIQAAKMVSSSRTDLIRIYLIVAGAVALGSKRN